MRSAPLISFGVLCYDVFTRTLYQNYTKDQNIGQKDYMEQGTKNSNVGSSPDNTTIKTCDKYFSCPTTKTLLSQYFHSTLFSPKTTSFLNVINKVFLKT